MSVEENQSIQIPPNPIPFNPIIDKFKFDANHLLSFCLNFGSTLIERQSDSMLDTKLEDLENRWRKLETSFEHLMLSSAAKQVKDESTINFEGCAEAFYSCKANIKEWLSINRGGVSQNVPSRLSLPLQPYTSQDSSLHVKLPPCDTEVFKGSYEKWPSFRDMFTAVYINGTNCPPVVKLFHLRNKTSNEAGAIVKRYPLCDDSFDLAWNALKARYENKRVLVDHQLQILFKIPIATCEDSKTLRRIHSTVSDVLQTLRTLDVNTENCDFFIVYLVCSKLPNETLALWEQSLKSHRELLKWSQLEEFLIDRYEAVERIDNMRSTRDRQSLPNIKQSIIQSYASQEKLNNLCKLCNEDHNLRQCPTFKRFDIQQRIDFVKVNKICNNCLSSNHVKANCASRNTCFICKKTHHTLLHLFKPASPEKLPYGSSNPTSPQQKSSSFEPKAQYTANFNDNIPGTSQKARNAQVQANLSLNTEFILLRTAIVHIEHMGELFSVRALIDPGSQRTFLSERIKNRLKLATKKSHVDVIGIGGQVQTATQECDLVLFAKKSNFKFSISAIILPKVTKHIPSTSFKITKDSLGNLELADPNFNQSAQIDLILGNDSERFINLDGIKKNICGSASAYNTVFGWVLSGPINAHPISSFSTSIVPSETSLLNELLRKFWEQEELPSPKHMSTDDRYCEQFYSETTTRTSDGRYVVRLPFKREFPNSIYLGASRTAAFAQYSRMKQTLAKNPELQTQYNEALSEYLTLDHMAKTTFQETCVDNKYFSYYLPHHAVVRPDHKTTKVRVVFNASRKTKSGFSLNDILHTGPALQQDLMNIILNWRKYRFVFSGDLQKMYRQILIHPDDRPFQRILFQEDHDSQCHNYELKTVTFGVNCAPFLAIRTLLQLASDSEEQFPKAASILRRETYVDDILSGGHSIQEALQAQSELLSTLESAGFPLKKITANNSELLSHIKPDDLYDSEFLRFEETSTTKTLGIKWNALTDSFTYTSHISDQSTNVTKRAVLSAVAKLFDPAGWINPIVIRAKMLMQQLWLEKLDWDQDVSNESLEKWNQLISELSQVENINIPRWIQYSPSHDVQIHGFSDASKQAYCAAVYVRCKTKDTIHCNLLVAKSKVAPLQTVCLPRLELNGAVLLANLVHHIKESLDFKESEVTLWTDSTIVLSWLAKPPATWETYVANRTSQIHQLVPKATWRHVSTTDNAADIGTRGCSPQELANNSLWWHGPPFLVQSQSEWPTKHTTQTQQCSVAAVSDSTSPTEDILNRFSSYHRALRVLCYVYRFIDNTLLRPRIAQTTLKLAHQEIQFVKEKLIRLSQQSVYDLEISLLNKSEPIPNKSSLSTLNPFLDSNGILRVNGRLSESSLPYNERFPIILPGNSRFCLLYLEFLHFTLAHAQCSQICRMSQTEFYITRLKSRIKKIIRHCKTCIIFKHKSCSQLMAPLPVDRCNFSTPFQTTGIDFAGPFDLKSSHLRNSPSIKGYVSVFVCFSTKAIHLEACSDLSTSAFRAVFARFIGRRGLPHRVVSDNGRNFLGASRELNREFATFIETVSNDIAQKYSTQGFEWSFIPPYAPHMGGLWEAAVKSFKFHFKRTTGAHRLNFEEFATVLARIEGVLNSRPISAISSDPEDLTALTPGHFLIGKPIMAFPEPPSDKISLVNRWEKLKAIHYQFSIRWKEEYLKSLQKRYKWKRSSSNLKIDDLVVVIDDLLPPSEWRLGRIIDIYSGADSHVRVADVRTSAGVITRPIVKLCFLPLLNETQS